MLFSFNTYALLLIICGIITVFISYYIYRKEGGAVRWFGLMVLSNAVWSIAYGFELASPSLEQIKVFINIEYIGITTLPLNWLFFCLQLSGKDKWYRKKVNSLSLVAVSVLTTILVWTNDLHHLHYNGLSLDTVSADIAMVVVDPGISYTLFTIYFYAMLAIGSYILLAKFRKADPIYKKQNYTIIIAAFVPWVANMTYLLGIRPLGNLDVTPFAFIITVLLIAVGIYRFKLFDILPVAREKVLDLMQDGFIVLDKKRRIIDYNLAFTEYLGQTGTRKLIGVEIDKVLPDQPDLLSSITEHGSGKIELTVIADRQSYDLEADIRYLNENNLNDGATIIKFQDLTVLRQEALKSKLQAEELQKLNQLKDRIFSIIAHDLRGPLVNLSEVLKMITNDLISLEEFKQIAPKMSKDIIYTTDLLENILHWSRSQLKGHGLNKEAFDVKSLIVNEINYHLPSATAKKVAILQDVFPGSTVYADMLMIQIVIRNLLNNAIKFCHENSTIEIAGVYQVDNKFLITVSDNGIGIPEEKLDALFTGENYTTRGTMNERGTGLGLVVCKDFIERNGGTISVNSVLGKGTKFSLTIPAYLE